MKNIIDKNSLKVKIGNLEFKNPIILASGILGISPSSMYRLDLANIGGITTKSIGIKPREGYSNPSIIGLGGDTFLNSVGLANPGIEYFEREIKEIKGSINAKLIVSIFGENIEDVSYIAKKAAMAGADAIEMNISCPHAEVSTIGASADLTYEFVKAVKRSVNCPVFVKMNPNVTSIVEIGVSAESAGADALVAINTIRAMKIDINTRRPILSHKTGGLSGKAIKPIGVRAVYELFESCKIPIIGCGGVFSWKDVIEYFLAGASAVQIGSALVHGEYLVKKLIEDLREYLKTNNIENIHQLTGKAH
ncbi:MAG: dihydroorotate dehydrogenase [Promethearchaeota archaeon]